MITQREHPLPDEIFDRVQRAMSSPNLSKEQKQDLAAMLGTSMMLAAACKLMLDDHGIE
jgi:hypothetical protein